MSVLLPASDNMKRTKSLRVHAQWSLISCVSLVVFGVLVHDGWAQRVEDLPDLTGGAVPMIVYETRDPFSSGEPTSIERVRFTVRVKNQTGDPLLGQSLVLIVEKILDLSGDDVSSRIMVAGADGYTAKGQPYFRVPIADGQDLAPFAESEPITLEFNNPDYLRFYPPVLRVRGIRRSPEKSMKQLLQTLVEKGILTPKEAEEALAPPVP
ncbi:MAG: hypothetical protein D6690_03760 [Nitrospirae bacterium]|nr:MAG: hypothetical protein D6690_03760 [Nitrospirota bacterium]